MVLVGEEWWGWGCGGDDGGDGGQCGGWGEGSGVVVVVIVVGVGTPAAIPPAVLWGGAKPGGGVRKRATRPTMAHSGGVLWGGNVL